MYYFYIYGYCYLNYNVSNFKIKCDDVGKKWFCYIYKLKLLFCENEEKLYFMFFNKVKINCVNII